MTVIYQNTQSYMNNSHVFKIPYPGLDYGYDCNYFSCSAGYFGISLRSEQVIE